MTYQMKEELIDMCNLSDGLIEYGEARGISIGEAHGAIKEAIKLYHDELNLEPSEIVSKITARFNLSPDEAEKYVAEVLDLQLT